MPAQPPLGYLHGYGDKAYPIADLTWGLLAISVAVIIIIALLVIWAIWRQPSISLAAPGKQMEVVHPRQGPHWILIGVSITTIILLASIIWTVLVLNKIRIPDSTALTIEVTGHQWWWEVKYLNDDAAQVFLTANEIHIPAGKPVLFKLKSADVIHSFWVPALSGKTDTIPGLTNETWLEAKAPGTYLGQCTEYCGLEHAKMKLVVIAQNPADFEAWRLHQLQSPENISQALAGAKEFQAKCASCHAIRGTEAAGMVGPDLSHLSTRTTIAAGTLPNDPEHLKSWISDPQALKPGSLMPKPEVTKQQLDDISAYLEGLQ